MVGQLIEDGASLIRGLKDAGARVASACWIRSGEDEKWVLYLSLPMVDRDGPLASYRTVQKILQSTNATKLGVSDVVIVGEDHPIAKSILGLGPRRIASVQTKPILIGPVLASGFYIYTLDDAAVGATPTSTKVIVPDSHVESTTTSKQGRAPVIRPGANTSSPFSRGSSNGR